MGMTVSFGNHIILKSQLLKRLLGVLLNKKVVCIYEISYYFSGLQTADRPFGGGEPAVRVTCHGMDGQETDEVPCAGDLAAGRHGKQGL